MSRPDLESSTNQMVRNVPLYRQKRKFTCGPSSLMMVMSALDERYQPNETAELEIWREATTIHGGCGPVGLALALKRRGFAALVVVSHDGLFLKSRASQGGEVEVMQILQERDLAEADQRGIPVHVGTYSLEDVSKWMAVGWYPIVMVSIEFEARTITHWVVVTGADADHVFFNDPLRDPAGEDAATRVDHASFASMTEFGPSREKAVILAGLPKMANVALPLPRIYASHQPRLDVPSFSGRER
ncbi:Peptidase_C39 like family protein [Bradyrhizobium sp. Rc3b]|uniref:peptidase C39 family protein n=1 Tax=Bradyrhizobium sp. Rc3b TaxID=1855322 RepID=UPI0008F299B8|nr:peptidase C39 family protein [Bradyrhizobium sp. Rc3b]SFN77062.1 Peptidase_C39 like family protein [Bradyrhizobium sp. Rc3b]